MDKCKCKKCGFEWMPRVENPKACPSCKSYDLNNENGLHEIINNYHGTKAFVMDIENVKRAIRDVATNDKPEPRNKRMVKRLHDALCGLADCVCGDNIGARPDLDSQYPDDILEEQ